MKKYFILASAVAMMLSACSFDHELDYDNGPTPEGRIPLMISTTSNVGNPELTRSTENGLQENLIKADATNVKLGLFIFDDGATKVTSPTKKDYEFFNITSTSLTAGSTTGKTAVGVTETLLYPSNKSANINIYAYAPFVSSSTYTATDIDGSTAANKITLAVQQDQSTNANYLKSDILWGCVGKSSKGNYTGYTVDNTAEITGENYILAKGGTTKAGFITGGNAEVIVPMLHKGAKFIVKLTTSGMPLEKLEEAKVYLYTNNLSSTMDLATGVFDDATGTEVKVTLTDKLGYTTSDATTTGTPALTASTKLTTSMVDGSNTGANGIIVDDINSPTKITHYVCSGIIPPQTKGAGDKLIEIELNDGNPSATPAVENTKYLFKLPTPIGAALSDFDSGKVYTYTITVKASGLSVVASVENWDSTAAAQSGTAELQ